jgi:predicted O-methyltransferase YrrM
VSDDFDDVERLIAHVDGWLTVDEARTLYDAARACTGRGAIVEIGSWKGKSTIVLARGSRAGSRVPVYAVDPHADYRFEEFRANVERAGIADLVRPIRSLSQPAADTFDEPIELLFVDGSHDERLVREDAEKWLPKVVDGGFVAFHDTTWHAGPRRVVGELVYRGRGFKDVRFVLASTTAARKVTANTFADRLRARLQLAKKTAFWLLTWPVQKVRRRLPKSIKRLGRRLIGFSGDP